MKPTLPLREICRVDDFIAYRDADNELFIRCPHVKTETGLCKMCHDREALLGIMAGIAISKK